MAATDIIKVQKVIVDATNGNTMGLEEPITLADLNVLTPPATVTTFGPVKQMTFTAQLAGAPTQADFNSLLTKLIAAGQMAAS